MKFNNGYQNIPTANVDENGYMQMPQDPYATYNPDPTMMLNIPYPTPPQEVNVPTVPMGVGYAQGGKVKKDKGTDKPYHVLAELLRQQGKGEDTILAHINPFEVAILKSIGGSGSINPKTGLPQFGFFDKPWKATTAFVTKPKRALAEIVGLGSAIFGGPVGGALGGAAKEAILGRSKNMLSGALGGGLQGAFLPGAANLIGSGLSNLGAKGIGGALQNYGTSNMGSWLGNMGQMGGGVSGMLDSLGGVFGGAEKGVSLPKMYAANSMGSALQNYNRAKGHSGVSAGDDSGDDSGGDYGLDQEGEGQGFFDKLLGNSKDYFSKPSNLLTAAVVGSSLMNRPKEEKAKTPEQMADEEKRLKKALMLSPDERAAKEADLLAEIQMQRRIARNQFLPEERLGNLDPVYRKSHSPEERKKYGKWFSYYNNPNLSGEPVPFYEGGEVSPEMAYGQEQTYMPPMSNYIMGHSKGQDDDVNAKLSTGEFVIPADIVSDLGDGNNSAGAKELYALMRNIRKHKRGGSVKLPPKAKPMSHYLRRAV